MVKFVVKSVVNICGKNCGEIEKLLDWKKKIGCKKKQPPDSRTRGPAAPAVLVFYITKRNTCTSLKL